MRIGSPRTTVDRRWVMFGLADVAVFLGPNRDRTSGSRAEFCGLRWGLRQYRRTRKDPFFLPVMTLRKLQTSQKSNQERLFVSISERICYLGRRQKDTGHGLLRKGRWFEKELPCVEIEERRLELSHPPRPW